MTETDKKWLRIFEKVLVVDDDSLCVKLIVSQLKALGATTIDTAEDGQQALERIQSGSYSLILQDWKLPGLSGLALFNRIRIHPSYQWTPILVVSGFINKNDFRLLQEFPCTELAEKPFTQKIMKDRVSKLAEEVDWYHHNRAIVDEVFATIDHDPSKLSQVIFGVLKKSPNPGPLVLIAVKAMAKLRAFKAAQSILEAFLKLEPDSIMGLNELGKILMHRGKHKEALKVLGKAQDFSSENVSRLCLMGEANLNLFDFEKARDYFSQALGIDKEDPKASAGYRIAENMIEHKHEIKNMGHSFASLLNTVGIAMIRNGHFQKGIEQYLSALTFMEKPVDKAKLAFNLGLGYLKWGQSASALTWFSKSQAYGQGEFVKSANYVRRLEKGMQSLNSRELSDIQDDHFEYPAAPSTDAEDTQQVRDDQEAKIDLDFGKDIAFAPPIHEQASVADSDEEPSGAQVGTLSETDKSLEALSNKIAANL